MAGSARAQTRTASVSRLGMSRSMRLVLVHAKNKDGISKEIKIITNVV